MSASSSVFDLRPLAVLANETPVLAWATLFLLMLTAWMVLEIVVIRLDAPTAARRDEALRTRWEPLLFGAALGDEMETLPGIARRDRLRLLRLWCQVGDQVSGEALERVAVLGARLGLGRDARRILSRPGSCSPCPPGRHPARHPYRRAPAPGRPVGAARTARGARPAPPIARRRALVAIDAARAATDILPALVRQGRWARHLVEDLVEAGVCTAIAAYARLLTEVPARPSRPRPVARPLRRSTVTAAVRARLGDPATQDPDAIAALLNSLGLIGDPRDKRLIRAFVAHAHWVVRMRAAEALGHCGDREDAAALVVLLGDSNWYTRYHAARALLRLPGLGAGFLHQQAARATDRFARDMARHVLAETASPAVR